MKTMTTLLAAGLCALALTGCETNGGGYGQPYGRAINEGPVRGGGGVVVVDRTQVYRGDPGRDGRYDGRDDRRDGRYDGRDDRRYDGRADDRRYGRDGDRDPCLGRPGYDPRYDRCDR